MLKYLFWGAIAWAVFFAISKMFTANRVLTKVTEGAQKRKAHEDPNQSAYRRAVQAILADLLALERITPQQAEVWSTLPIEQVEEQLLARGAITLEQWDQLWQRFVVPALREAEASRTLSLDPDLQEGLRNTRKKRED